MDQGFRRGFTTAEKTELWDRWQRGESLKAIGRAFGKPSSSIYFQVSPHGGIRPPPRRRSAPNLISACWPPIVVTKDWSPAYNVLMGLDKADEQRWRAAGKGRQGARDPRRNGDAQADAEPRSIMGVSMIAAKRMEAETEDGAPDESRPRRMLNERQVLEIIPVSRTTLFRMMKTDAFQRLPTFLRTEGAGLKARSSLGSGPLASAIRISIRTVAGARGVATVFQLTRPSTIIMN